MSDLPLITHEQDGVLVVRLNRPDRGNSLSLDLLQGLIDAIARARVDDAIKAIALTGSGDRLFSSGADLTELAAGANVENATRLFGDVLLGLIALDKPTAAFLNGNAMGGGAGLAFACDDVYAAETAQVALPEVKAGLFPYMILPVLERAFGPKAALSLAMDGGSLAARTLAERGWISGTFGPGDRDGAIAQWAAKRTGIGHSARCQGKHLSHQDWLLTLEKRLNEGRQALVTQLEDPSTLSAIKAVLARSSASPV